MSEIEHAAIDAAKEVMDSDQLLTELCIYAATNDLRQLAVEQQIKSQLAQLTREVEVYRAACQAVVKADLLCNDGSISNQIEAAIEQARAALAIGKEK